MKKKTRRSIPYRGWLCKLCRRHVYDLGDGTFRHSIDLGSGCRLHDGYLTRSQVFKGKA